MGIISEAVHESAAAALEKALLAAVKSGNPGVIQFCREHIYPVYVDHVGESFGGVEEPLELKQFFGNAPVSLEEASAPSREKFLGPK